MSRRITKYRYSIFSLYETDFTSICDEIGHCAFVSGDLVKIISFYIANVEKLTTIEE